MRTTFETIYGPIEIEYKGDSMVYLTNMNEMINIVDHARGGKDPRVQTEDGLKQIVSEWVEVQEEENDGFNWYRHYQEHGF